MMGPPEDRRVLLEEDGRALPGNGPPMNTSRTDQYLVAVPEVADEWSKPEEI